jgi:hypothetical protein
MGCMVAGFAASSFLFSLVFRFFFLDAAAGFLVVLASVCSGVGLLASLFVVKVEPPEEQALELTAVSAEDKSVDQEDSTMVETKKSAPNDLNPLQCLRNLDFLLLVLFLALVNGPGLLWITIQGSVARSLGIENSANLVAILAVCSVTGRFVVGYLNDACATRITRSWFLLPCAVVMGGALLLFGVLQRPAVVYVTAALVGAAYG